MTWYVVPIAASLGSMLRRGGAQRGDQLGGGAGAAGLDVAAGTLERGEERGAIGDVVVAGVLAAGEDVLDELETIALGQAHDLVE